MNIKSALKFGIDGIKRAREKAAYEASDLAVNAHFNPISTAVKIGRTLTPSSKMKIGAITSNIAEMASLMSKPIAEGDVFNRKLTNFGKSVGIGFGVAAAASGAQGQRNQNDMGRSDGSITTATPSIASYMQKTTGDMSAGATGDLVFALDRNRESGFL